MSGEVSKHLIDVGALFDQLPAKGAGTLSGVDMKTREGAANDSRFFSELRPGQFLNAGPINCAAEGASAKTIIAIVDSRTLVREALTAALSAACGGVVAVEFADLDDWLIAGSEMDVSAVLLGIGDRRADDPSLIADLQMLARDRPGLPVIVMGEHQDPHHVFKILSHGARGYVPTTVSLEIAIRALYLAIAGGLFVPAAVLAEAGQPDQDEQRSAKLPFDLTDRQAAVAEGVAQGKPNKIIAYELNLSESTVKVHIRVIMKKMQARNRTEIAFKLHSIRQKATPRYVAE